MGFMYAAQGSAAEIVSAMLSLASARTSSDLAAATAASSAFIATTLGGTVPTCGPPPRHRRQSTEDGESNMTPAVSSAREQRLQEHLKTQQQQQSWPTLCSLSPALTWLLLPGAAEDVHVPSETQLVVLWALRGYLGEVMSVCLTGSRDTLRLMVDLLGSAAAPIRRVSQVT